MSNALFDQELPAALAQADNLPTLPTVALEVLRLTEDEDSTIEDLANALSRDPALAAKLLKLSNSSLFGMGQEITTLQRATMSLGMKTVKLMSLSFSLASASPKEGQAGTFDFQTFWQRSLISAVAARTLAQRVDRRFADEAFLCGLLGHFGKLVLAQCLQDTYASALERDNGWPRLDTERELMGFDSNDVAVALLKSWQLPEVLCSSVGYGHRLSALDDSVEDNVASLARILHATVLMEIVLCDEEKRAAFDGLKSFLAEHYDMDETESESFLMDLEPRIVEGAEMLEIRLPEGLSHQEILNSARMQIVSVSLGTAVDLRQATQQNEELSKENERLQTRATTDRLTGLPNRAAFEDFYEHQVATRFNRDAPRALGVILVDVDHFKSFNDTHGHQAGDEVLRVVGKALAENTRKGDLTARYGGEEFVLVAPFTNTFGLKTISERLRSAIEACTIEFEGKSLKVTASFGGACIARFSAADDGRRLIKLADHFLYKAKENGRNRVEVYGKVQFPGQ